MHAEQVVRRLGGRAGYGEILRHSTEHQLRTALTEHRVIRLRRGVYGLPDLPPALAAATRLSGLLSHASAAQHWGMPTLLPPEAVHVMVPRGATRPSANSTSGVVMHYADSDRVSGPGSAGAAPATSPLRTVLDCAATLAFREALAIADSAARLDLVGPEELRGAATNWPARGRRRVMRVAEHVDAAAANPFESGLRAVLIEAGIRGFETQMSIRDGDFQAYVDLADRARGIVLEADSFEWHGKRKSLNRDCWRYDELVSRGWLVLRFSWEQVMFHPDWIAVIVPATRALRTGNRGTARSWSPQLRVGGGSPGQVLGVQRS